jgi:hypothetical protein
MLGVAHIILCLPVSCPPEYAFTTINGQEGNLMLNKHRVSE